MSKEEEFNLSEKGQEAGVSVQGIEFNIYREKDVKEFIRRLKERLCKEKIKAETRESCWDRISQETIWEEIDKLAGEKLIEAQKNENAK